MKIALAGAAFRNGDPLFNTARIRHWMTFAKAQGADLVCFGEAFLQGFDAFSWDYENDRQIAVSIYDDLFLQLLDASAESSIDLLFGFLERDGEALYSSCALLGGGELIHLYRRVSKGWKEFTRTDEHYCEGDAPAVFEYRGHTCMIALCGDLWDDTAALFKQNAEWLFWPLYINYSLEEWYGNANERQAYAKKAAEFCRHAFMINCMDEQITADSPALGGCCWFNDGTIKAEWPPGSEGMLIVSL